MPTKILWILLLGSSRNSLIWYRWSETVNGLDAIHHISLEKRWEMAQREKYQP